MMHDFQEIQKYFLFFSSISVALYHIPGMFERQVGLTDITYSYLRVTVTPKYCFHYHKAPQSSIDILKRRKPSDIYKVYFGNIPKHNIKN